MSQKINETKYFIVDRIEAGIVALENDNREIIFIKKEYINEIINEGDVLYKAEDMYIKDENETAKRKDKINELMKGLWVD